MKFELPEQDPDEPIRAKSVAPPPNYSSRAVRMRLFTLFGALVLVIILMQEAGKPERWEWMGFDKVNKIELESNQESETQSDANEATNQRSDQNNTELDTSVQLSAKTSQPSSDSPSIIVMDPDDLKVATNSSDARIAFWAPLYRSLNSQQQQTLMRLLKNMRQGAPVAEQHRNQVKQLIDGINKKRQRFQQNLFDQLAVTPNGSQQKKKLADDLFQTQEIWDKTIYPAMQGIAEGEEITLAQQQAIVKLQSILDRLIFEQVLDHTTIGWSGDTEAWKRIWERALQTPQDEFPVATRIQLVSQPEIFRGRPVQISGWVRSVKKKMVGKNSELGVPHYFELWVRPKESKLGPYCVYSDSLPEGFPAISDDLNLNEHVTINAFSFKLRTYIASDESVRECPALIATSIEPVVAISFTDANRWQPSRTLLIVLLTLIPIVATGIAWLAFRNSETVRFSPGVKASKRISNSLDALKDNPMVQTDQEKIMSLYESDPTHE